RSQRTPQGKGAQPLLSVTAVICVATFSVSMVTGARFALIPLDYKWDCELAMRPVLKRSYLRTIKAAVALIARTLLIALCAAYATGCSKSNQPGVGKSSASGLLNSTQIAPDTITIDSIPFGELNRGDVYNASDVIPLADSRFLFCDNNTNDALFELDLTPDGRKKGPLIRRPLQGLAPYAVSDIEDMALVEDGGRRYVFITSSM